MNMRACLLAVLFAAGCASYSGRGLEPGVSTEAQVRALMGSPAAEYANPGGSRMLAYPHGPLGIETFMAEIGPDGRLVAVRQVLNEESFRGISRGMTRDQVLRHIGPPGETMEFPNLKQVAWDYRFRDVWGYTAIFSVMLDGNGIVVSTFTRRLDTGRNDKF